MARSIASIGMSKNLHIDQIGTVAELNRNMLLGLIKPQEFLDGLIEARISEKDAREIITSINDKIFLPLHAEVRGGDTFVPPVASRPAQPQPQPVRPPAAPVPPHIAPLPPRILMSEANIKIQAESRNRELPPKVVLPRAGTTLGDVVRSVAGVPDAKRGINLLEDHEEPHIELHAAPVAPAKPMMPAAPTNPKPMPDVPPNLPGTLPARDVPVFSAAPMPVREVPQPQGIQFPPLPKPVAPAPRPAVAAPAAPVIPAVPRPAPAPVQSYSSDPYREPIDEPKAE